MLAQLEGHIFSISGRDWLDSYLGVSPEATWLEAGGCRSLDLKFGCTEKSPREL